MKTPARLFQGAVFLAISLPMAAKDEWQDVMDQSLKTGIQLTKLSLHGSISTVGSKFSLKTENVQAMPTDGFLPNVNVIENGRRKEANIGTRAVVGILNASTRKTQGIQIEPGSLVGIVKIGVDKKYVDVEIVTLKQEKVTLKGNNESEYLWTQLVFQFPSLSTMDPEVVRQTIFASLAPQDGASINPKPKGQPAPVAPISESGPRVSPSGNNQLVGKTLDEMKTLLGTPNNSVELGGQTVYIYTGLNIRVAVKDGRVVSVQ